MTHQIADKLTHIKTNLLRYLKPKHMYGVGMHNTIKTHLELGHSIRSIAKLLGLSRNTVRSIARQIDEGESVPKRVTRKKKLSDYQSDVSIR